MNFWSVSGSLFTGTVVTVGVGKDYETLAAAYAATLTTNTLYLCYAGTYSLDFDKHENAKKRYYKAMDTYGSVIFQGHSWSVNSDNHIFSSGVLIFEGIVFDGPGIRLIGDSADNEYILNRCAYIGNDWGFTGNDSAGNQGVSKVTFRYHDGRHAGGIGQGWFTAGANLSWTTYRCLANAADDSFTSWPWGSVDTVAVPTVGYGPSYGADLIVLHEPVLLNVTPSIKFIIAGTTQQFTATGVNDLGASDDLTTIVTWTSSDEAVATVGEHTGLATGVAIGDATITAAITTGD